MMPTRLRQAWANSLRSGKRYQIKSTLRDNEDGRCCLGDLGDVAGLPWVVKENDIGRFGFSEYKDRDAPIVDCNTGTLTDLAMDLTGLSEATMMCFTAYNDEHGLTFPQIADIIDYGYAPKLPNRDDYSEVAPGHFVCQYPYRGNTTVGEADAWTDPTTGIRWYPV